MNIQRLHLGRKIVLVGIRLDAHAKELLDWALLNVADQGDCVVAIHVRRKLDGILKEKILLDGYLEEYEDQCNKKEVSLSAEVLKGNSTRKVLVREAKKRSASAVIVGINKQCALGRWASVAKYCAKRLPVTTEVMALSNGKVSFSRCSRILFQGPCLDPKLSFCMDDDVAFKDNQSDFGESELSETSRFSFDRKDVDIKDDVVIPIARPKRGSLSSISLPVEDFTKQRPGWPLLQASSSVTQQALEARNMSVVQWVMTLPHRSTFDVSTSNSPLSYETDDSAETENGKESEANTIDKLTYMQELPEDLEVILAKNAAGCRVFSHNVLKMATSNFSTGSLIGNGSYNSVYKGILPDGQLIAIKTPKSSNEALKDFIQEVDIITSLKHKGIAPLLGICIEHRDLISVYSFLPKGNLTENIQGNVKESSVLSWEARFRIAVGIAEALNYLHNEPPRPVIHRDVKSSNILLTDELEPQLCDFGLAIWAPTTASFLIDSDVVGTFGYLAPEYFMYGKVSDKVDVYAFGVVLLELLSGRTPIGLGAGTGQESLVMWAKPKLEIRDFGSLLDPKLAESIDEAQMQSMGLAAALCLTQAARRRPNMYQILNILRGEQGLEGSLANPLRHINYENHDEDDEVYPDSSMESHMSLALVELQDSFTTYDEGSPLSVEEYLHKRWSRSTSMD